jgi:hypothetical protein
LFLVNTGVWLELGVKGNFNQFNVLETNVRVLPEAPAHAIDVVTLDDAAAATAQAKEALNTPTAEDASCPRNLGLS